MDPRGSNPSLSRVTHALLLTSLSLPLLTLLPYLLLPFHHAPASVSAPLVLMKVSDSSRLTQVEYFLSLSLHGTPNSTALSSWARLGVGCLGKCLGWGQLLTCRDEKDARAEDDIVSASVELAGCHAEPAKEQQRDAEDGEDTGGPHSPCGEKGGRFQRCPCRPQAPAHLGHTVPRGKIAHEQDRTCFQHGRQTSAVAQGPVLAGKALQSPS